MCISRGLAEQYSFLNRFYARALTFTLLFNSILAPFCVYVTGMFGINSADSFRSPQCHPYLHFSSLHPSKEHCILSLCISISLFLKNERLCPLKVLQSLASQDQTVHLWAHAWSLSFSPTCVFNGPRLYGGRLLVFEQ